jgi:hypothetical protein
VVCRANKEIDHFDVFCLRKSPKAKTLEVCCGVRVNRDIDQFFFCPFSRELIK